MPFRGCAGARRTVAQRKRRPEFPRESGPRDDDGGMQRCPLATFHEGASDFHESDSVCQPVTSCPAFWVAFTVPPTLKMFWVWVMFWVTPPKNEGSP